MTTGVVLAIEVSQRQGGVAAARVASGPHAAFGPRRPRESRSEREPGAAAIDAPAIVEVPVGPPDPDRDRLMPAIDEAFTRLPAAPAELSCVVVSIGPGGFTGLRMATAIAKSLSLVTGCRIVAVPSAAVACRSDADARRSDTAGPGADACAKSSADPPARVLVALAGKGDDAWISCVQSGDERPCRIERAALLDAAGFERLVRECGDAVPLIADEHLPAALDAVASARALPRRALRLSPSSCLREGLARLASAHDASIVAADDLLPLYPREPEAVRLWRERSARRATA